MTIEHIQENIEKACKRIAPVWPLENSVAVNPFLGLTEYSFEQAAQILKYRGDINLYMPLSFYMKHIEEGKITKSDIAQALGNNISHESITDLLLEAKDLINLKEERATLRTLINIIDTHLKSDFSEVMINHISEWMSSYFYQHGQISPEAMFSQWRQDAAMDLYPELSGVTNFRNYVKTIPNHPNNAILAGLEKLNIPEELIEEYLHSLLLKILGWSSYCAGIDWQNQLYEKDSGYVKGLLAIIISWESVLLSSYSKYKSDWIQYVSHLKNTIAPLKNDRYLKLQSIFQDSLDFSFQRKLVHKLNQKQKIEDSNKDKRPRAQMIFCIDVRSEVYRRNLELVDNTIETKGFAGFFGFPVKYYPINHEKGKNQCPVLIPSGPRVYETIHDASSLQRVTRTLFQKGTLNNSWRKFKKGSISSFSFVSPLGLFYLPKLISDAFGWTTPTVSPKKKEFGEIIAGHHQLNVTLIPFDERVKMALSALTSMGLTQGFAPLVLITGHGASSVNNSHASSLDCGACGGNSGEINALTAQLILNDKKIREALKNSDVIIPDDTLFIACLHNTTTDTIHLLDEKNIPFSHFKQLNAVKESLALASQYSRESRAPRLGITKSLAKSHILKRAKDWAQVRPEWGLAGCSSFIIAPRSRTIKIDLEGKAFLHSYDRKTDEGFKVLESIMTAPMIVTSWINLQYYASTVDNKRLGAGNKTLHNITAELGVTEGAGGDLRIGLPHQSIHDGKEYQHLPIRLNVIMDAPRDAIMNIIRKHNNLSELFDNKWIYLFTLNDIGKIDFQYLGNGNWKKLTMEEKSLNVTPTEILV